MKLKPIVASLIMLGLMAPVFAVNKTDKYKAYKAKDVPTQQSIEEKKFSAQQAIETKKFLAQQAAIAKEFSAQQAAKTKKFLAQQQAIKAKELLAQQQAIKAKELLAQQQAVKARGLLVQQPVAQQQAVKAKDISVQQAVVDQNSFVNRVCSEGWFNRITFGGAASVVGIVGTHDLPGAFTTTGNGSDLYVNNANLLVDATLSKWSKASLNLAYLGAPTKFNMISDNATSNKYKVDHRVFADEFYVTLAGFAKYPFYAKIGKAYVPFGEYSDPYVLWQIESPAQMISQANGPTAIIGMASDFGFYASVFALKGDTYPQGSSTNNIRNFGAKMGYKNDLAHFSLPNTNINFNVSCIRNMWDSQFFTTNAGNPQSMWGGNASAPARDPVGALAVHFDMSYKALSVYADWAGALKSMAPTYYTNPGYSSSLLYAGSSRFWGANVNAAYAFATLERNSSLSAGIQFSGNGQWFTTPTYTPTTPPVTINGVSYNASDTGGAFDYIIPKWRALGEYKINLFKHTDLSFVYAYSKSYNFQNSSKTRRSTSVGLARLGVKF